MSDSKTVREEISRRRMLYVLACFYGASLTGCELVRSSISQNLGHRIPDSIKSSGIVGSGREVDLDFHTLSRISFGPFPGDLDRLKAMGASYLEEQLHPDSIDDKAADVRVRRFESLEFDMHNMHEFKKEVLRSDMARFTMLKAIYSRRQLLECLVEFWSDHFNISIDKGDCIYLKPADQNNVIRKHALGNFRDLVLGSARSPAMLIYLDGKDNHVSKAGDRPNENYARELLELHTMGVYGGYTQQDVYEVARALSGFKLHDRYRRGEVYFDRSCHDDGPKKILGHVIAGGGGEGDLEQVIDILMKHPTTAHYVAYKLSRYFVSDNPDPQLVKELADTFKETKGEIKPMLRQALASDQFKSSLSRATKFKRPFRFMVSSIRALAGDTNAGAPLVRYLERMGQPVFQYPTPDGYPMESQPWMGTLLWRWNFAMALCANKIESLSVDLPRLGEALNADYSPPKFQNKIFPYLVGRLPDEGERQAFSESKLKEQELLAMILCSPAFQMH